MSDQYMKELLRIAVAQICQTIGYNSTQTAPLELLQDVLDKFLKEFTRDLRRQVEHYNRTEANLNDVTLTLNSINVNLNELLDYINNVEPVPFALEVPKFPARKDSALNFLKPGSKEVLTRRVHIHDHLPPMLPPEITPSNEIVTSNGLSDTNSFSDNNYGNNNGEGNADPANKNVNTSQALDKNTLQSLFKPTSAFDDSDRPTREVSSVVMTTGGYISPAVEGKMPEAMVPDIIDKLLGLDAPPPPPPPPPPPQPKPPSRSATSTPIPHSAENLNSTEKDTADRAGETKHSSIKETKKILSRNLEPQPVTSKKLDQYGELPFKKDKTYSGKTQPHENHPSMPANNNKKSFMMHQNAAGIHTPQSNYANMLLKKAKKQKVPLIPGQSFNEKHSKPVADKTHKLDNADKAHRKYMKMLQKMAKQGKIPPEILNTIMGPDKKSKIINPAIVASMPPGPEKQQLEKLMRKQAKQRQKMLKQQIMEAQKQAKKPILPPPLVPIFPPARMSSEALQKPLNIDVAELKMKTEQGDLTHVSPVKSAFKSTNNMSPQTATTPIMNITDSAMTKIPKCENPAIEVIENSALTTADGKELKLSNEPDRSKLNIFKKISKQKTPKSSSPTPMRIPGLNDTPIINLPSGTTITPTPGPVSSMNTSLASTTIGRNIFPPLPSETTIGGGTSLENNSVINVDDIKDKTTVPPTTVGINPNQPTDLSIGNRVFGEKPIEAVELVNKPKKRGRKPGSKNSPKIPGVIPNNLLKKNSKKANLANNNLFIPNMASLPQDIRPILGKKGNMINSNIFGSNISQIPPDFLGGLNKKGNLNNANIFGANFSQLPQDIRSSIGNLKFDNMAQFFPNPITNTAEWSQNKQLQQQMMIMAGAKERKEHKKKNKLLKQELLNNDNKMANTTTPLMAAPTCEEVQSINKKLMRMDTILKAQPSNQTTDLTVDTNLMTDKKLSSPSVFPASTSPLKSPGNSKRLITNTENLAGSLVQPFMLPNRPPFPNLPGNMLSMLQFPFPTRPGLIPTPGLFPTPGLAAFPNNPKNPLIPGIFPFPNLKQTSTDNIIASQETEDLSMDKKKLDTNLQSSERSYCNVAPLVPDFLTKLNDANTNTSSSNSNEPDLPKTPKPRNAHSSSNLSQDNFAKKLSADAHTPESSIGGKSIPSTPGGMSLSTFEQLMKKNENSPIDLIPLAKHSKSLSGSQESGLDFSMTKKQNHPTIAVKSDLAIKTPITLNNEPIEVSDDSDETNHPQLPPIVKQQQTSSATNIVSQTSISQGHKSFSSMDDMFAANTVGSQNKQKPIDSELTIKEFKKLKKQVKKSSTTVNTGMCVMSDKSDGLAGTGTVQGSGVGKLAGGADLIPLTSTGLAYSSKNIPYNSLTANANPTFNAHKSDFNLNNPTSSSAGSSVFDNLTITAAIPSSSSGNNLATVFDMQKKRKEHKKLKKLKELKEGKIKKKKDKKDKNKNKEKAEKYLLNQTHSSTAKEKEHMTISETISSSTPIGIGSHTSSGLDKIKGKDLIKKLKKEKKKEKQRTSVLENMPTQNTNFLQMSTLTAPFTVREKDTHAAIATSSVTGESEPKKQKLPPVSINTATACNESEIASNTPITSMSNQASLVPKLTLKLGSTHSPTPPRENGHKNSTTAALICPAAASKSSTPPQREQQREPSPELARISPLVTRPPKHKLNTSGELASTTTAGNNTISAANVSTLDIVDSSKAGNASAGSMIVPPPSPWLSGGTISASSVLLPHQLLQTTKQHDIPGISSSNTHITDNSSKTANADRQSPLTLITETSRPSSYIDAEGNRVWICPACGKVDDGSPMIGCDGCDAWYHWVCVGIFVAPKDNEDWFCRVCITRKKGLHGSDKKRKRNKKK